jgi:hypothetical protein
VGLVSECGRDVLSTSSSYRVSIMSEIPRIRRNRHGRPCDTCKRKKGRCVFKDGVQTCMLCQAYNLECTFVEAPKPRKKAPRNSTIPSAGDGVSPTASSSQRTQDTPGREGRTDIIGHGVPYNLVYKTMVL